MAVRQKKVASPVVEIGRFTGIPQEDVDPLEQELKRLGFHVRQSQFELGPQNAMEWALPSLVSVLVSAVGTVGVLTFKKYMDGLLEELGVKNLGSQTGKALKHTFQKGAKLEAAYYRRLKESIDPVYCPPLKLVLRLGGDNDLTNPPWQLKFIFTRELEEFFDQALECVSPVVRDVGVMRLKARFINQAGKSRSLLWALTRKAGCRLDCARASRICCHQFRRLSL